MTGKRIAVISDIHGNSRALKVVLEEIEKKGVNLVVNLGDSLYGGLEPALTADILMEKDILSISGNQDLVILNKNADLAANQSLAFVRNQLQERHIEWLEELPFAVELEEDVFLCHGAPEDDSVYLLEEVQPDHVALRRIDEIKRLLGDVKQRIILCGHSHIARAVYIGDGRMVINPGSVGLQAYDDVLPHYHRMECGNPSAKYCIVSMDSCCDVPSVEFHEVPYDWNAASDAAIAGGRPDWGRSLLTGFCD